MRLPSSLVAATGHQREETAGFLEAFWRLPSQYLFENNR